MIVRYQTLVKFSPRDFCIVPREVITEVDIDSAVPVECDERSRGIGEDMERGRGEGEDVAYRNDDLRYEALEGGLVRGDVGWSENVCVSE
jgi:hypothetical protein